MKKQYKITLYDPYALNYLLRELNAWHVKPSRYTVKVELYTTDSNVVDVATESFLREPQMCVVEQVKEHK